MGAKFRCSGFLDAISKRVYGGNSSTKTKKYDYEEGLRWCKDVAGYQICGFVADGLKGLSTSLFVPFGLCQVHVQRAVRTKLTLHPKSEAARELLAVANGLCKASKKEFLARLNDFEKRHYQFINEKNFSENGRAFFVYKRLRSALNSLKGISKNQFGLIFWSVFSRFFS